MVIQIEKVALVYCTEGYIKQKIKNVLTTSQLTHDVAATLLVSGHLVTRDVTLWQRCRDVVATL